MHRQRPPIVEKLATLASLYANTPVDKRPGALCLTAEDYAHLGALVRAWDEYEVLADVATEASEYFDSPKNERDYTRVESAFNALNAIRSEKTT